MTTQALLQQAKAACPQLAWLGSEEKNRAILQMADAIEANADVILAANAEDLHAAQYVISSVMLDRLRLTKDRIVAMADGMRQVAKLPDPVGEILAEVKRPNGLVIRKTAVPMGVVAIIYESRPNVTSDAAVLALKSGNVCVLRGGKEAYCSAAAIVAAMHEGLRAVGLPEAFVNLVSDTTRQSAHELMTANGLVDLLIPRGGAGLIRACVESATVPCIETGTGICHVYVDKDADLDKALNIIENAKTSRPSVCNAEEVSIVHADIAGQFLPMLKKRLVDDRAAAGLTPVELRLDETAQQIISGTPAGKQDFDTEFLDYILAVKTVSSADEAIAHIAAHSTHHSDAIITENAQTAQRFAARQKIVDHEHAVAGMDPLLGDEQRDLFLVSIGKNLTLIQAAFDVVALGLFRINHGLAVPVRANRGKGNAAGLCGQNEIYVVEIKTFFEFICDASHKRTVDAVIEKPVDLYNVSGQNLALLDDAILQLLHSFLQKHNK